MSDVKSAIKKVARQEDKALAQLQKYFESGTSNKPAYKITLTTNLSVGSLSDEISSEQISVNMSGQVIERYTNVNRELRHSHNIEWKDIDNAYKTQLVIHALLKDEYEKAGKIYGGRTLYAKYSNNIVRDASGKKRINNEGNAYLQRGLGYGGRYTKVDVDIQKRVLERIYSQLYKETNKHLLDKFEKISLDGSSSTDFKKLIRASRELITDIKKTKDWIKTVDKLVASAELKYKQQVKEMKKAQSKDRVYKRDWILSIGELEKIGTAILGLAVERCPIETGFLRSSGKLYVSDNDIRIIFECPYAAYVHDNMSAQHPIGQAKFLESAAQDILPKISIWTETTGNDSFVLGDYMKQTWDKDSAGNIKSSMYWLEHKGYQAVYIDIDRNLHINYAHYK